MTKGISQRIRKAAAGTVILVAVSVSMGLSSGYAQGPTPAAMNSEAAPVLLSKDKQDVNGDGILDTIAYFDTDNDGLVDAEAIDIGSTGTVSVMAIRCDADGDGRSDDWAVVDAATEELRAALIDKNDDGEVDAVSFSNGESKPIQVSAKGDFAPVFQY